MYKCSICNATITDYTSVRIERAKTTVHTRLCLPCDADLTQYFEDRKAKFADDNVYLKDEV